MQKPLPPVEKWWELRTEGEAIIKTILLDLNRYSDFIRASDCFRREVDFDELCIALALYGRVQTDAIVKALCAIGDRLDRGEDD